MRGTIRRINIPVLGVASALMAAAALLPGPAAAAAPANNLLKNVAYYTVNGSTSGAFCRWAAPQKSVPLTTGGTASQSRNSHAGIELSITGATTYADDGFYVPLGTLGSLVGYTVLASNPSSTFSTNLWFDTNTANDTKTNGDFFSWSGGCYTTAGGDSYSLGPASTTTTSGGQSETVTGSTTFLCPANGSSFTLAQFQAGDCAGISSSTLVAVWIGITAGSGGTLSTTITSAQATTQ